MFIPSEFRKCDYPPCFSSLVPEVPSLTESGHCGKGFERWKKVKTLNKILRNMNLGTSNSARSADDLAAVLFTSGTEGVSKGVMFTHNNIISSEKAYAATFNLTSFDTILLCRHQWPMPLVFTME